MSHDLDTSPTVSHSPMKIWTTLLQRLNLQRLNLQRLRGRLLIPLSNLNMIQVRVTSLMIAPRILQRGSLQMREVMKMMTMRKLFQVQTVKKVKLSLELLPVADHFLQLLVTATILWT